MYDLMAISVIKEGFMVGDSANEFLAPQEQAHDCPRRGLLQLGEDAFVGGRGLQKNGSF
jgi:hypothetical protein